MRDLILILIYILSLQFHLKAQEANIEKKPTYLDWIEKAEIATGKKDYTKCISCYKKAQELRPEDFKSQYGIAQCFALDKKYKSARSHLIKTIELDWASTEGKLLEDNSSFKRLKRKKRHWRKVKSALAHEKKDVDLSLRKELLEIYETDQKYRGEIHKVIEEKGFNSPEVGELWMKQSKIDEGNLKKVETIIAKHGYPSDELVGKGASKGIFYVIQHSDVKYQEKYLPIFLKASQKGALRKSTLALMIDRIETSNNRPQIYGTQIGSENGGEDYVYPIRDAQNVDKRRAFVGLPPLNDYLKRFNLSFKYEAKTYLKKDFQKFVRVWDLVAIRNAETYELLYEPERNLWVEFTKTGRLKYNINVNTCEIPFKATDKGRLILSPVQSCTRDGKDDEALKKRLNYQEFNQFELFDRHLYLMDTRNQLWEFKRKVFPKRSVQGN